MYKNIRVTPFIKYKCSFYFGSTYTLLNLIYYSLIFLFTENNGVLSQTANCDFLAFKQASPNTVLYRKGWNSEPRRTANINCNIEA